MSIAQAVWEYPTRTLSPGTANPPTTRAEEIAEAIWVYGTRTLTTGGGDPSEWVTLDDTLGAAATSYSDTTVTAGVEYDYRVLAVNASGTTPSNIAVATAAGSGAATFNPAFARRGKTIVIPGR